MIQTDDTRRTSDNPFRYKSSKPETPPTFQQLLQRDGSKWSRLSLQKPKKHLDLEDKQNHYKIKSVIAKVKEKAKKLKHSLSGKKCRDENDSITRSSDVGTKAKGKEDAEYNSARMFDFKRTPASILKSHSERRKDDFASSSNAIAETQSMNRRSFKTFFKNDTKDQVATTVDVPKVQEHSYQLHFVDSKNSNNNSFDSFSCPDSPTKTRSTPLCHVLSGNEYPDVVTKADQTRVPSHTVSSIRRVPISGSVRTRVPNRNHAFGKTNARETRFPVSTGDQGRSAV